MGSHQLLFVGLIRHMKGLDVFFLRALASLIVKRPEFRLLVVGAAFYRSYQKDQEAVQRLAVELGIADRIRFAVELSPREVAETMRRSAVLVVQSRRETFSAVTAEAIACGTPVVATRCGGPEESSHRLRAASSGSRILKMSQLGSSTCSTTVANSILAGYTRTSSPASAPTRSRNG